MKNTSILSAWACIGALVLASEQGAWAQSYTNGFEPPTYASGNLGGQDTWVETASRTNTSVRTSSEIASILSSSGQNVGLTVHEGSQALILTGTDASTTSTRVINGFSAYANVTLDTWARPLAPTSNGPSLGNVFFTIEDSTGNRAAAFRFGFDTATTNAHIDFASGLTGATIWTNSGMAWTTDTWYHFTFNINYADQVYNFSVNGTQLNASPIPFYNNDNVSTFGRIGVVRGASQAGMILDDLSVSSIPAVAPIVRFGTNSTYGYKFRIYDVGSWTPSTNTITVKLDGTNVGTLAISQYGDIGAGDNTGYTTVADNRAAPFLALGSQHTLTIHYEGSGFSPTDKTITFTVQPVQGSLDRTHHYFAQFRLSPHYGTDGSGHTGLSGDYALDMGNVPATNSKVFVDDLEAMNAFRNAVGNDVMSVSLWIKRRNIGSSSVLWFNSPTAPVSGRAFQLHCPYSDNVIYFDTGGGTVPTSRLQTNTASIFGTAFWTNSWHHVVAIKNGGDKQIWVDGSLVIEQTSGAASLSGYNDLNWLIIGAASPDALVMNGLLDDFAAYSSALTPSDIAALHNGTAPNAISSAGSLMAWWDFNDAPSVKISHSGPNAVVNFNQTLQVSTNVAGPYVDVTNFTGTLSTNTASGRALFFRAHK